MELLAVFLEGSCGGLPSVNSFLKERVPTSPTASLATPKGFGDTILRALGLVQQVVETNSALTLKMRALATLAVVVKSLESPTLCLVACETLSAVFPVAWAVDDEKEEEKDSEKRKLLEQQRERRIKLQKELGEKALEFFSVLLEETQCAKAKFASLMKCAQAVASRSTTHSSDVAACMELLTKHQLVNEDKAINTSGVVDDSSVRTSLDSMFQDPPAAAAPAVPINVHATPLNADATPLITPLEEKTDEVDSDDDDGPPELEQVGEAIARMDLNGSAEHGDDDDDASVASDFSDLD